MKGGMKPKIDKDREIVLTAIFNHIEANEFDKAEELEELFHVTEEEWHTFVDNAFWGTGL